MCHRFTSSPPAPSSEGRRRVPCPRAGAPRCCLSAVGSDFTFCVSLFCVCTWCPCWLYVHWLFISSSRLSVFTLTHTNTHTKLRKASTASGKSGPWVCPSSSAIVRLERLMEGSPAASPLSCDSVKVFFVLFSSLCVCKENKVNMTHSHSFRLFTNVSHTLSILILSTRGRSLHTVVSTMSNGPRWRPAWDPYFSSSSPVEQCCFII